jgi:pimeloyl-ACP methyl ester carboxylesterase
MLRLSAIILVGALLATAAQAQAPTGEIRGPLPGGGDWVVEAPANWNGTVLLYSHGYSPVQRPAESAPRGQREAYLAQGYGLAASSYSRAGWALEQAQVDQWTALDAFTARYGKPKRVIAWGDSMGGLTSIALAERHPERLDGALAMCGSISGVLGMMNTALDGAFAFKTLLAPSADLRLVRTGDDRANGAAAQAVLDTAMKTPQGRARVALAAALAQLPTARRSGKPGRRGVLVEHRRRLHRATARQRRPVGRRGAVRQGGAQPGRRLGRLGEGAAHRRGTERGRLYGRQLYDQRRSAHAADDDPQRR